MPISDEIIRRVTDKIHIEEDTVRRVLDVAFEDAPLPTATEADLRRHIHGIEKARRIEKDNLKTRIDEQGAQLSKIRSELQQYRDQRDPYGTIEQIFLAVGLRP